MTYMNNIGKEEIMRRKTASDNKNNTEDLTFDSSNNNARADAYRKNRDLTDRMEIQALSTQTDEGEMLAELEKLEQEYIDND